LFVCSVTADMFVHTVVIQDLGTVAALLIGL